MNAEISLTLSSLAEAYRAGTSPKQIVEQVYARIDAVNDPGIFLCLFPKEQMSDSQ